MSKTIITFRVDSTGYSKFAIESLDVIIWYIGTIDGVNSKAAEKFSIIVVGEIAEMDVSFKGKFREVLGNIEIKFSKGVYEYYGITSKNKIFDIKIADGKKHPSIFVNGRAAKSYSSISDCVLF